MSVDHAEDLKEEFLRNESSIGQVWQGFHRIDAENYALGGLARDKARKAYKSGDKEKWKRLNAIARVHERNSRRLAVVICALQKHVPSEFLAEVIPF